MLLVTTMVGAGLPASGQRAPATPVTPLASFGEPAISPIDRRSPFVSGGDIWTVPAAGGEARLLVSHAANESRPLYSPDGKRARLRLRPHRRRRHLRPDARHRRAAQLTFDDGLDRLDGWSRDGQWIYFSSTSRDIAGMNDLYRVSAEGGTPMPVSADRYTSEFFAAPSPDGQRVAFTARGNGAGQWWRNGHSHLDESELWLLHDGADAALRAAHRARREAAVADVDAPTARASTSCPTAAARRTSGRCRSAARPRQVTHVHRRPRAVAVDLARRPHDRLRARLRGLDARHRERAGRAGADHAARRAGGAGVEHVTLTNGFQDLALSPDGRKIAVRRARRNLRGVGERRRRCGARHAQPRARGADRLDARQPAHRLRLRARRRRRICSSTTSRPAPRRS